MGSSQLEVIPVFHCFDDNYVLPAAVAFDSLLRHASPSYSYRIIVAGSVAERNRLRLREIVDEYPSASLEFIGGPHEFGDLFAKTLTKGHYSKEMFYKLLVADLLPDCSRAIVTDVDVVWLDDISQIWEESRELGSNYLAGVAAIRPPFTSWLDEYWRGYELNFSSEEMGRLLTGAGLWVFNLQEMRSAGIPQMALQTAMTNAWRLRQPEQDVINLLTYPRQQLLKPRAMVCSYMYEIYSDVGMAERDLRHDADQMRAAYLAPIQLHYAGGERYKPWHNPGAEGSIHWVRALAQTEFLGDWLQEVRQRLNVSPTARSALRHSMRHPFPVLLDGVKAARGRAGEVTLSRVKKLAGFWGRGS